MNKIIETVPGSGHPTVHPNGRHILTDAYEHESISAGDGTIPIRLIDLETQTEEIIIRMNVSNPVTEVSTALRVDSHPAWVTTH